MRGSTPKSLQNKKIDEHPSVLFSLIFIQNTRNPMYLLKQKKKNIFKTQESQCIILKKKIIIIKHSKHKKSNVSS